MRSSRRASSMMRSNSRTMAPRVERAAQLGVTSRTCAQHFASRCRLIDVQRRRLLQAADLQRARGALVQQPHELLVELVDLAVAGRRVASRLLVGSRFGTAALSAIGRRLRPSDSAADCAVLGDDIDQRAADDRGIGVSLRPRARAPAARCRSRAPPAAPSRARMRATSASRADCDRLARAGDAQPRNAVQKPAARAPPPAASAPSVVVGLSRKIDRCPAVGERVAHCARLLDRQIEHQHAIDAGRGGARDELVEAQANDRIGVGEEHDRAPRSSPAHAGRPGRDVRAASCRRGQRAFGRALDDRAVGQRIRKRHADLEHVGAGALERQQNLARTLADPGSPAVT